MVFFHIHANTRKKPAVLVRLSPRKFVHPSTEKWPKRGLLVLAIECHVANSNQYIWVYNRQVCVYKNQESIIFMHSCLRNNYKKTSTFIFFELSFRVETSPFQMQASCP